MLFCHTTSIPGCGTGHRDSEKLRIIVGQQHYVAVPSTGWKLSPNQWCQNLKTTDFMLKD